MASRACNAARLAIPFAGAAAGIVVAAALGSGLVGYAVGGAVFLSACALAEWLWRRCASAEDLRADLEDRVRNPPA